LPRMNRYTRNSTPKSRTGAPAQIRVKGEKRFILGPDRRKWCAVRRISVREKGGPLQVRKSHRTSGEQLQIGELHLLQKIIVSFIAVLSGKSHGQAKVIDFTHIQLMRTDGVQSFEKQLSGIGGIVKAPLQLFTQPAVFPSQLEDKMVSSIHANTAKRARS
jgi:hypothetical protein